MNVAIIFSISPTPVIQLYLINKMEAARVKVLIFKWLMIS